MATAVTYYKRFRMEVDLEGRAIAVPPLAHGYELVAWRDDLVDAHAEAKFRSFHDEIDANVFSCLGELTGCHRLMREIRKKEGFLPGATWLIAHREGGQRLPEYCGTIQGVRDRAGLGAVQNLGVAAEHRGQQLGTILMLKALQGFQAAGLRRTYLEVTAQNAGAIQLYQRLGFVRVRTVYKAVEVAYS